MTEQTATVETIENGTKTFEIPAQNRTALEARLTKLAKRAAKLGAPIAWSWGREIVKTRKEKGEEVHTLWVEITVSTARPCFGGWEFLGTLNHTDIPGHVLRKMVPGVECPAAALAATPGQCDHCRKVRSRLETFVVRNGEDVKVVGRNCIADFLGHQSPAHLAGALSFVFDVESLCEEAEGFGFGGGGSWHFVAPLLDALALAFTVVRVEGGYVPRSFEGRSTASALDAVLWPSGIGEAGEAERRYSREIREKRTEADCARAWEALAWLADADGSSDFIHNLRAVASRDFVNAKNLGYLAAIVPAFDREAIKRNAPTAPSTHVGTVGERVDFGVGTVLRMFGFNNDWGGGTIVIIRLANGALLKWAASNTPDWMTNGVAVKVRATVKKHDEYKGTPQTVITRAKLEQAGA